MWVVRRAGSNHVEPGYPLIRQARRMRLLLPLDLRAADFVRGWFAVMPQEIIQRGFCVNID
jgi:hypothetical protein